MYTGCPKKYGVQLESSIIQRWLDRLTWRDVFISLSNLSNDIPFNNFQKEIKWEQDF